MNAGIFDLINFVVEYATDYLMPFLLIAFVLAVIARLLITVTIHRQKAIYQGVLQACASGHHGQSKSGGFFLQSGQARADPNLF